MNTVFLMAVCLSFAVYLAYNIYALVKIKEIPHSISQTWYRVPWQNGMTTSYQIMLVLMMPVLLLFDAQFEWAKIFGFITLAALWGVGGAPDYWDEGQKNIHNGLTYVCEGGALLFIALATSYWWVLPIYAVVFLTPCFILHQWKDCRSFWLEQIAFFSFYTSLIIQIAVK